MGFYEPHYSERWEDKVQAHPLVCRGSTELANDSDSSPEHTSNGPPQQSLQLT
jgi:hypothetical protein